MQPGRQLRLLMQSRGLTQQQVAEAAGVSQSSVSRMLKREPVRQSGAYGKLCTYIHERTPSESGMPSAVLEAVWRVWDGTDDHADALAELIHASGQLWPELSTGAPDHQR